MPAFRSVFGAAALLVTIVSTRGLAADQFDRLLSQDKQAVHVLNRLAYGPTPADLDLVRKMGVGAWIRDQLHPERIQHNAALESRLKPLESARLAPWEAFEKYQLAQAAMFPTIAPPTPVAQLLTDEQITRLQSGTLEERTAILAALTEDTKTRVLVALPPEALRAALRGMDQKVLVEAFNLRSADSERRTAELRRLRPPLTDLLTQEQIATLMTGADADKTTLLTGLDPEKRRQVLRQVAPLSMPQAFRREAVEVRSPVQLPLVELTDAKIYRAVYSPRQLEEVLVDFWVNHFNVFSGKGPVRMLLTSYERDAIRPHVLGRFRDMVLATARHPAMLFYLDNWQSQVPRPDPAATAATPTARRGGLNENYGRELMELHTLGVDGGYTQADVVNVARAFTGWTIHEPNRYGEFHFDPAMHDREQKEVLGHTIPRGGGESDGIAVIDILSRHPSTARFISRKLAQRFVADEPPQRLVDRMAATFAKSDGDLRAVMETLLLSPEFLSEGAWQAKVKSPLELAVSALRALNADVSDTMPLAQRLVELGQPLYGKTEPTGYPNASASWLNSASLIARINFVAALTSNQISGVTFHSDTLPSTPRVLGARLLGTAPTPAMVSRLERQAAQPMDVQTLAALVLASPDFQKR